MTARADARPRLLRLAVPRTGLGRSAVSILAVVIVLYAVADYGWWEYNDFLVDTMTQVAIFACAGVAWNLSGGFAGLLSFGHAAFFGLGAYALALWMNHASGNPWLGLLIGTVAGGALAALTLLTTFRLKGHYFIMATVAVVEILYVVFENWSAVGASSGIFVALRPIGWANLSFGTNRIDYACVAIVLLALFLVVSTLLSRSRLGFLVSGTRDDEVAAASLGVRTFLVRLAVFTLSGALAGLAGAYYAVFTAIASPDTVMSLDVSTQIALVAIIGGLGWAYGSVYGAVITVVISSYANADLGQYGSGLGGLIYGALIIVIALFEPRGLHPFVRKLSAWVRLAAAAAWHRGGPRPRRPAPDRGPSGTGSAAQPGGTAELPGPLHRALPATRSPVLTLEGVSKHFGGLQAVSEVSFDLGAGEIVAVVGANGAGKTTLFNCVSGRYKPTSGVIRLGETSIAGRPAHQVARFGLARTFQLMRNFAGLTVRENCLVAVLATRPGMKQARTEVAQILAWAGLLPLADVPSRELTTADLKRLEVCRALLTRPRVLLLDEVMSGLNPAETRAAVRLIEQVRDAGISVVLVEHIMDVVRQVADRVVVLDAGKKLADGGPDEVLRLPAVVEAYLGAGHAAEGQ